MVKRDAILRRLCIVARPLSPTSACACFFTDSNKRNSNNSCYFLALLCAVAVCVCVCGPEGVCLLSLFLKAGESKAKGARSLVRCSPVLFLSFVFCLLPRLRPLIFFFFLLPEHETKGHSSRAFVRGNAENRPGPFGRVCRVRRFFTSLAAHLQVFEDFPRTGFTLENVTRRGHLEQAKVRQGESWNAPIIGFWLGFSA